MVVVVHGPRLQRVVLELPPRFMGHPPGRSLNSSPLSPHYLSRAHARTYTHTHSQSDTFNPSFVALERPLMYHYSCVDRALE